MTLDNGFLWAFFSVFVRASAMMLASPFFGAHTTPVSIRVMATLSIAGALSFVLRPSVGPLPEDLHGFTMALLNEAATGLLIGLFTTVAFTAFQIAGALLDLQIGLGASQVMNPVNGVPSTLMSQYKSTLAIVIFVMLNGHHMLVQAFLSSYRLMPMLGESSIPALQNGIVGLVAQTSLLGLQIAAPVMAVGIIVDAALGLINKAVPQMPVMLVGMPAKLGLGLVALGVGLPAMVASVSGATDLASQTLSQVFRAAR